jgi:hypothetical protein
MKRIRRFKRINKTKEEKGIMEKELTKWGINTYFQSKKYKCKFELVNANKD